MINFRLLRHLCLFLAVAEKEHFGRAAEALGISQPPLTEHIKVLEYALKVKLFERSRQGTRLTPEGRAILPVVQKFAEHMQQLERAVYEALQGQYATLTIGAITQALTDVLPAFLERLKTQFPQLTVSIKEIDSVEALPLLRSGTIDLAFARLEGEVGKEMAVRTLAQERLAVALPWGHRCAQQSEVSLSELANEAFVMFARSVSPSSFDTVIAACRAQGFSPRVLYEVRSAASQIAFVSCGQGIALVPFSLQRLAPAHVCVLPIIENISITTTAVAWQKANQPIWMEQVLACLPESKP